MLAVADNGSPEDILELNRKVRRPLIRRELGEYLDSLCSSAPAQP
jgi:hypothetical protein